MNKKHWYIPATVALAVSSCYLQAAPVVPGASESGQILRFDAVPLNQYGGEWEFDRGLVKQKDKNNPGGKIEIISKALSNFTVSADIKITDTESGQGDAGFLLRSGDYRNGADSVNGYYVGIQAGQGIVIGRFNQRWNHVLSESASIETGTSYNLKAVVNGQQLEVYLNGSQVATHTMQETMTGSVGLRSYKAAFEADDITLFSTEILAFEELVNFADTGYSEFQGNWSATGSVVTQADKTSRGGKIQLNTPSLTDMRMEATVRLTDSDNGSGDAGILLRSDQYQNGTDSVRGYYLGLRENGGLVLGKLDQNRWQELAFSAKTINRNQDYQLKADLIGDELKVYLDGELLITHTGLEVRSGSVGVRGYRSAYTISNLKLRSYETLGEVAIGSDQGKAFKLKYSSLLGGYYFAVNNGSDELWATDRGPVELRTSDTANQVSGVGYAAYQGYNRNGDKLVATATINTSQNSQIQVTDSYSLDSGELLVDRAYRVDRVSGSDKGWMLSVSLRSRKAAEADQYKWFAPGSWYGNDSDNFGADSKLAYDGIETATGVDSLSAPILAAFDPTDKHTVAIVDRTAGVRETIWADQKAHQAKVLVSGLFNLPGLGLRTAQTGGNKYIELTHAYPAVTKNFRNRTSSKPAVWRMKTLAENETGNTRFALRFPAYNDFNSMVTQEWRKEFDHWSQVDDRVDMTAHFNTLASYVDRSYGTSGGVVQYATNYDHHRAESGFLWRNTDLAWLMLERGHTLNNSGYLQHAREVINEQVNRNRIANGWIRAEAEGLQALVRAYATEKKNGVEQTAWRNYFVNFANQYLNKNISNNHHKVFKSLFLQEAYKATNDQRYLNAAVSEAEATWLNEHSKLRFRHALTDYAGGPVEHDREAGAVALELYLALYDHTNDRKWVDRARVAADYLESWNIVQDIRLVASDLTQSPNRANTFGNEHVKTYGLSYVHAGAAGTDLYIGYNTVDYLRLYELTNEKHYLDFAKYISHSTTLYTDMGDKTGWMADPKYNSGQGFTNEYIGVGANDYWDNAGRGFLHDSNLGWTTYVLLAMHQRLMDHKGVPYVN